MSHTREIRPYNSGWEQKALQTKKKNAKQNQVTSVHFHLSIQKCVAPCIQLEEPL